MRLALHLLAGTLALFAIVAGFSSAKEWYLLKHLPGYERDHFTVTGTEVRHGEDYFLRGQGEREEYAFLISSSRYEAYSSPAAVGQKLTLFRNPSMPSIAFQKESLNVIFEDDWREAPEVAISAKSTLWIAVIAGVMAGLAFALARSIAPRRMDVMGDAATGW